jgi:excisionase family DNA binding protein
MTKFLTVADLSGATGIHHDTLYRAIRRGDIPAVRIGNSVRIPASYLADLERAARLRPATGRRIAPRPRKGRN